MKPKHLFAYFSIFIFSAAIDSNALEIQLGVNLVDQGAFVNMVNHTNRFQSATSFDENGWPESDFELVLMDNRPAQEWNNDIDDPEVYRIDYSGTYKCSFIGRADVESIWSAASIENYIYDENENITYFDLVIPGPPETNHSFTYLTFTNTRRNPGNELNTGISNLKVIRPGYDLNTEKVFTDEYINLCKAANFSCYRYYTLQNIWNGEPDFPETTQWENRKTPDDATQKPMDNLNGKRDAWCWEYIVELANILKKDIWVNLHISCDSVYVVSLAEFLKKELDPDINIYVENSNEVWSPTHMRHGPYNQAQAEHNGIGFNENYARRTVELSDLFARVFGADAINKRIRVILAGQHAYNGRSDIHLNYINDNIGTPKNYIYATSTALYFGSDNAGGTVAEINQGMLTNIQTQIDDDASHLYRINHISKAMDWDLPGGCTSYEGGPHLPAGGGKDNLPNQINAHRTVEMKEILHKNYKDGWFDIGGGLAMHFTLSSSYSRYGCWGLTDDFNFPDRNYKMQAVRDLVGGWTDIEEVETIKSNNSFMKIFPNPGEDIVNIEIKIPGRIKICDLLGNTMYVGIIKNNKAIIDLSGFSSGVYVVLYRNGHNTYIEKLVVR